MALRRLYLDTNVLVEAFEEPGSSSGRILALAAGGHFLVVESEYLVREVEEVFGRLFGPRVAAVTLDEMRRFPLHEIVNFEASRDALEAVREHTRDKADAPHFAAARTGLAEALVTWNRRSVLPTMFALVPTATPEDILPALEGASGWPSTEVLRSRWERWAMSSPRSPR